MNLPVVLLPGHRNQNEALRRRRDRRDDIDQPAALTGALEEWLELCNNNQPGAPVDLLAGTP